MINRYENPIVLNYGQNHIQYQYFLEILQKTYDINLFLLFQTSLTFIETNQIQIKLLNVQFFPTIKSNI